MPDSLWPRWFVPLLLSALIAGCSRDPVPAPVAPAPPSASRVDAAALASLGRDLFFDASLSSPPGQSCASCHDPRWAFSTPRDRMNAGMAPGAEAESASPRER